MKKEILLYKWGEGRGQGRIGASFVARGRTLNTVTVLVTALFFFSYYPGLYSRPHLSPLAAISTQAHFPSFHLHRLIIT
jgi:hypothetical protein